MTYTHRSTLEVLQAAKKLIESPEHWAQLANARDADDKVCYYDSTEAVKFCARGALLRVSRDAIEYNSAIQSLRRKMHSIFNTNVAVVNDTLGHDAVMQAYDAAIHEERINAGT